VEGVSTTVAPQGKCRTGEAGKQDMINSPLGLSVPRVCRRPLLDGGGPPISV
jgi:hypothetical protein